MNFDENLQPSNSPLISSSVERSYRPTKPIFLLPTIKEAYASEDISEMIDIIAYCKPEEVADLEECYFFLVDFLTTDRDCTDLIVNIVQLCAELKITNYIPLFSLSLAKLVKLKDFDNAAIVFSSLVFFGFEIYSFALESFFEVFTSFQINFRFEDLIQNIYDYQPKFTFTSEVLPFHRISTSTGPTEKIFVAYFRFLASKDSNLSIEFDRLSEPFQTHEMKKLVYTLLTENEKSEEAYEFTSKWKLQTNYFCYKIEHLCQSNQFVEAWNAFKEHLETNVLKQPRLLVTMAKTLVHPDCANQLDYLISTVQQQIDQGVEFETVLFNIILDHLQRKGRYSQLKEYFDCLNNGLFIARPDSVTFNTMIKAYCHMGDYKRAYDMFDLARSSCKVNDVTYNSIIDVAVRDKNMSFVWEMISEMQENDIKPDGYTYSTIIKGLKQSNSLEHFQTTMEMFDEVKKLAEPDEILFNCVMDACLKFHKVDEMFRVYEELERKGVRKTSVTFGILMKGYAAKEQFDKVYELYQEMKDEKVEFTAVTFGCLINICIKNDELGKAREFFKEMRELKIPMNTILYTTEIKIYSKERNVAKVIELFTEMKASKDNQPNNITYNSVIDCLVKSNKLDKAEKVMKELISETNIKPDLITFSTLIKGFTKEGLIDEALNYAKLMVKHEVRPDEILLNSFLDGCEKNNKFKEAPRIFDFFLKLGVSPSLMTYSLMLKLLGKARDFEKSELVFKQATEKGCGSVILHTCFMKTCFTVGKIEKALSVLKMFIDQGGDLDNQLFELVIGELVKVKNKLAVDLFEKYFKKQFTLKPYTKEKLLKMAGTKSGKFEKLMKETQTKVSDKEYLLKNYTQKGKRPNLTRQSLGDITNL